MKPITYKTEVILPDGRAIIVGIVARGSRWQGCIKDGKKIMYCGAKVKIPAEAKAEAMKSFELIRGEI